MFGKTVTVKVQTNACACKGDKQCSCKSSAWCL